MCEQMFGPMPLMVQRVQGESPTSLHPSWLKRSDSPTRPLVVQAALGFFDWCLSAQYVMHAHTCLCVYRARMHAIAHGIVAPSMNMVALRAVSMTYKTHRSHTVKIFIEFGERL